MRRRIALLLIAATAGMGSLQFAPATAAHHQPTAITKTCGKGYVHAKLSWGEKCLRAGEFCKVRNREYLKYGFYCPATRHLRHR